MKKQAGEALREFLVIIVATFALILLTSHCNGENEKEFREQCASHGGHIIGEGKGFIGVAPDKYHSGIKYLCVDDKGCIVE